MVDRARRDSVRRMPKSPLQTWYEGNPRIFDELGAAAAALAQSAGRAGRMAEQHGDGNAAIRVELEKVATHAGLQLAVVLRAQALEPIPDADTRRHFDAALARWSDAAETIAKAAGRRDASEMVRSVQALEAGTNKFLRSAAALGRATGQRPDPTTPIS
jgi:hypothetical protein